jgi:hypothetical protein
LAQDEISTRPFAGHEHPWSMRVPDSYWNLLASPRCLDIRLFVAWQSLSGVDGTSRAATNTRVLGGRISIRLDFPHAGNRVPQLQPVRESVRIVGSIGVVGGLSL